MRPTGDHQRALVIAFHHLPKHETQEERHKRHAGFQHHVAQNGEGQTDQNIFHHITNSEAAKQADHQDEGRNNMVRQERDTRKIPGDGHSENKDEKRCQDQGDEKAIDGIAAVSKEIGRASCRERV